MTIQKLNINLPDGEVKKKEEAKYGKQLEIPFDQPVDTKTVTTKMNVIDPTKKPKKK